MRRSLVTLAAAAALLGAPLALSAHNAGHIILPDGTCHEIGSFKHAPLVGKDRTQLDLVPETSNPPFDEIGVSFVGFWQLSDIRPGPCPAQAPMSAAGSGTSTMASSGATENAEAPAPPAGQQTTAKQDR